jgi:site-specific DNA recombinase
MKRVRCAVYTRKSSDEGLEQDFNSLDAQFEACSAYIQSQASEGWAAVNERYDDGGVSGGTLERPALKRLLADIASGLIDIVVVYKIDRLTRSLLDFAKLVEAFDMAGTSFVSITQSFNTTTSMGRLTLNMLLSFAQFEREVTAERIRDKIAASKARGMWMGGTPPLGYAPDGRTLKIVEKDTQLIRDIYQRYLVLGNVRMLAEQLQEEGIAVPLRTAGTGRTTGGGFFMRGQLYKILGNPIYRGEIRHGKKTYPGLHDAIIDRDTWQRVELKRANHVRGNRAAYQLAHQSILAGKLFDEAGQPLIATHACKGPRRYRYYVSRHLHHKTTNTHEDGLGWRVPAKEIESLIALALTEMLGDPIGLLKQMNVPLPAPQHIPSLLRQASTIKETLTPQTPTQMGMLIDKVMITDTQVHVAVSVQALCKALKIEVQDEGEIYKFTIPAKLTRSGVAMKLVQTNGTTHVKGTTADTLLKTIARGHTLWQRLKQDNITLTELATREGVTRSYASRILMLAFLDPWIIEQIIEGKQPAHLDLGKITKSGQLPMLWNDQRAFLGFTPSR